MQIINTSTDSPPDTLGRLALYSGLDVLTLFEIKSGLSKLMDENREMRIGVKNITHDTMQMSHAWALELEKSLRFLGSIFLNERDWKSIRTDTVKQND